MRVFLISGEPAFRSGFRTVLESSGDLELVGDAADARGGFHAIDVFTPDVVVIDMALRGMDATAATREVKRRAHQTRVLLLAASPRERDVLEGFAAGADGFALKTDALESMLYAIRCVGNGTRYLSDGVRGLGAATARAIERSQSNGVAADVLDALSPREREVLGLVIKGWRNRDMARELCVSIKTIDTHRTHINRKLHCRSSAELIRFAADNGLLRDGAGKGGDSEVAGSRSDDQPARTIVLLVDDNPAVREALSHDLLALEGEPQHEASITAALAATKNLAAPALMVIDPPDNHGVWAVAVLREADASDNLLAALDKDRHGLVGGAVMAGAGAANSVHHRP